MSQSKFWCAFYIVLTIGLASTVEPLAFDQSLVDLRVYYHAAQRIAAGLNPYEVPFIPHYTKYPLPPLLYIYPPFVASILSFFAALPFEAVARGWMVASIVAISAGVWFLLSMFTPSAPCSSRHSIVLLSLCIFPPVLDGLALGQVDAFVFLLLACAGWCIATRREITLGAVLALAVAIKVIPIVLVIVLLRYRFWRALRAWFCCSVIAATFCAFTSRGWQIWADFLQKGSILSPEQRGLIITVNNYSIGHFLIEAAPWLSPASAWGIAGGCGAIAALWLVLKAAGRTGVDPVRVYAGMVCAMMLLSPSISFHHILWLVLPFAAAWQAGSQTRGVRALAVICLVALGTSFLIDSYLRQAQVSHHIVTWLGLCLVALPISLLCVLSGEPAPVAPAVRR